MDLFLPELPKALYVSAAASHDAIFLDWLRDVCRLEIRPLTLPLHMDQQALDAGAQLILVDAQAPQADELCRHFRQSPLTHHLQVIALAAQATPEREIALLENGAIDYIAGPMEQELFLARIRSHLAYQFNADVVRTLKTNLESEVELRRQEIEKTQDLTILALTAIAKTRDDSTGNHIRRTQHYVRALARQLQAHPRFAAFLTPRNIDLLFKSAPLHDIGKVGIPDNILLKPGRLEPAEFEIMKNHPLLGRQTLEQAEQQLGTQLDFLRIAKEIAYCHHERWDGTGYPRQLKEEAIPISARLMALADVYDAVISRRVYKDGIPHDKAVDIIIDGRGSHFDPDVVDAFVEIADEFRHIALRFGDAPDDTPPAATTPPPNTVAATADPVRFGPQADPLLLALQERTDALSDEVAPFVVAMLSNTTTVPQSLSKLIVGLLVHKAPVLLGPVHHALAQMVSADQHAPEAAADTRRKCLALIQACRGSKAANAALRFVLDLTSLPVPPPPTAPASSEVPPVPPRPAPT